MRTLSLEQSVALVPDGASLMIGGLMVSARPNGSSILDEAARAEAWFHHDCRGCVAA